MKTILKGVSLSVLLPAIPVAAETRVEGAIRLSQLTLSAMECTVFAKEDAEANRLFQIAIDAGRKFLALAPTLTPEEQKAASPQIAVLWGGLSGPSVDFVLGEAWHAMSSAAYKKLGDDTKRWDTEKVFKYADANCRLIR
ncbi:hypothetical protein [Hyphomicrobium sp. 99]|uniref:hypothetical protein n=1 Tax=Hyphomicrobium sp. 99 TaxID=1163419 RepID=UPI0005F784B7|nr:hypothetical protein [Hyphomicrobium sp. 99]